MLHVHYRRFNARTDDSVADGRIDIPPRGSATCRFFTHHPSTFTCSAREPELRSCHLYTGCRWVDLQISLPASPAGTLRPTVLTASTLFDASSVGSLSFTFSALTCRPLRADFSAVAHHQGLLNHSGTAWFEASFCTPAPRGLPSSPPAALGSRSFGLPFTSHQCLGHLGNRRCARYHEQCPKYGPDTQPGVSARGRSAKGIEWTLALSPCPDRRPYYLKRLPLMVLFSRCGALQIAV